MFCLIHDRTTEHLFTGGQRTYYHRNIIHYHGQRICPLFMSCFSIKKKLPLPIVINKGYSVINLVKSMQGFRYLSSQVNAGFSLFILSRIVKQAE